MIMPNEESECVHQVVLCIHLPASFIQRDNSDSEAGERERILKVYRTDRKFNLPIWLKSLLVLLM